MHQVDNFMFRYLERRGEKGKTWKYNERNNGWKLPNMAKDTNLQIQKAKWVLNRINPNKFT